MSRETLLAALLVSAGCSSTLPASEWVTARPRGACLVTREYTDAVGTRTYEEQYAADGRVLSGTSSLRYGGRAWERFGYDGAGRLATIDSYEEQPAYELPCPGCYTPRRRVVTHTALRHDAAGRLVRWTRKDRTYERRSDGEYVALASVDTDNTRYRFKYDDAGRLAGIKGKRWRRLTYVGGQLARVDQGGDHPWHVATERDARGRIVATVEENCTRGGACHVTERARYAYDDAGHLVRADYTDVTGSSPLRYEVYEYQGDRVVRVTRSEVPFVEAHHRIREYGYDARGRLTLIMQDGRVLERRRYQGACDAVTTGPTTPSALRDVGAVVCLYSPAYVMEACFPP